MGTTCLDQFAWMVMNKMRHIENMQVSKMFTYIVSATRSQVCICRGGGGGLSPGSDCSNEHRKTLFSMCCSQGDCRRAGGVGTPAAQTHRRRLPAPGPHPQVPGRPQKETAVMLSLVIPLGSGCCGCRSAAEQGRCRVLTLALND